MDTMIRQGLSNYCYHGLAFTVRYKNGHEFGLWFDLQDEWSIFFIRFQASQSSLPICKKVFMIIICEERIYKSDL